MEDTRATIILDISGVSRLHGGVVVGRDFLSLERERAFSRGQVLAHVCRAWAFSWKAVDDPRTHRPRPFCYCAVNVCYETPSAAR